jgi:hypothetical protein
VKVRLIQVDGKWPNLALMKLSAFHKREGDEVSFDCPDPNKVYVSCIFKRNAPKARGLWTLFPHADVEFGGAGFGNSVLPDFIEHLMPDYALYGRRVSMGFTSRGCIRACPWCDVWIREGYIRDHAPVQEFLKHRNVILLDNNFLASPRCLDNLEYLIQHRCRVCFTQGLDIRLISEPIARLLVRTRYADYQFKRKCLYFAWDDPALISAKEVMSGVEILKRSGIKPYRLMCYMLTCYNTSLREDIARFNLLLQLGVDPFVMRYNQGGNRIAREFSRWVNKRFYTRYSFADWLIRRNVKPIPTSANQVKLFPSDISPAPAASAEE